MEEVKVAGKTNLDLHMAVHIAIDGQIGTSYVIAFRVHHEHSELQDTCNGHRTATTPAWLRPLTVNPPPPPPPSLKAAPTAVPVQLPQL
jgi:hypothetical protein